MDFQADRGLLEGSQQLKTNLRKMKTIPKVHEFHFLAQVKPYLTFDQSD